MKNTKVIIRRAKSPDFLQLQPVYAEIDGLHVRKEPLSFKRTPFPGRSRAYFESAISGRQRLFLVAESGNKIAGFIEASIRRPPKIPILKPRYFGYISDMCVAREFCRSGIGSLLMRKAIEWLKGKSISIVELNVYRFNQGAIRFYENNGFKAVSQKMRRKV